MMISKRSSTGFKGLRQSLSRNPSVIDKKIFKIIVLGNSDTGKTCIVSRICTGHFPSKTRPTIVDYGSKVITMEGKEITLHIWDTAGAERYRRSMVQHYYRKADGVVFIYDVTNERSFRDMTLWVTECEENQDGLEIPKILLANKCDLTMDRAVPETRGQAFAEGYGMDFFEVSAKLGNRPTNLDFVFLHLAKRIRTHRKTLNRPEVPMDHFIKLPRDEGGICTSSPYCFC